MNKRKYPYGVDMRPQLKIHVGEQQIANGVLGPLKMTEIYEKTKHLLYQGVEASFEAIVQPSTVNKTPRDSKPSKQLQLDFNGKLCKPDLSFKNSTLCEDNKQKCNFCSNTTKLDVCGKCGDIFCYLCSLSLCSEEMNYICLTCYK